MFALGLLFTPTTMFRAFVRGRRIATSMYCHRESRSTLASMTLAELRVSIGLDRTSLVPLPSDRAAFAMWAILAFATILGPALAVLLIFLLAHLHGTHGIGTVMTSHP